MKRALVGLLGLTLAACGPEREELTVFAAASVRDACTEIAAAWERERPDTPVRFNFAGSNVLAQQILASGRADLFLSADLAQADLVRAAGRSVAPMRSDWLSNRLVVVVPSDSRLRIDDARDLASAEVEHLSLAHPEVVPAGRYAKQWLVARGAWAELESRVVPAVDVRAALALVECGAAQAGIVYSTDAALSARVRVAFRVPTQQAPRIEYALVQLDGRADRERAARLFEFFLSPPASEVFRRAGFVVRAPER